MREPPVLPMYDYADLVVPSSGPRQSTVAVARGLGEAMAWIKVGLLAGAVAAATVTVLPAHAGEPRTGTIVCSNGATISVEGQLFGNAYNVVGSTQNFVVTYLRVDQSGTELIKRSPGKEQLDTLQCTYMVSSRPGQTATVEGFLTRRS